MAMYPVPCKIVRRIESALPAIVGLCCIPCGFHCLRIKRFHSRMTGNNANRRMKSHLSVNWYEGAPRYVPGILPSALRLTIRQRQLLASRKGRESCLNLPHIEAIPQIVAAYPLPSADHTPRKVDFSGTHLTVLVPHHKEEWGVLLCISCRIGATPKKERRLWSCTPDCMSPPPTKQVCIVPTYCCMPLRLRFKKHRAP